MENTEQPDIKLIPASTGKRFVNYIIDLLIFSILISFLLAFASPFYPLMNKILNMQPIDLTDQLVIRFLYGLYMSVTEALLRGKTIGKYVSGTRAVWQNGLPINAQTAFVRGLIRAIPFEPLSYLFLFPYTWHDRWSSSLVVDEIKSNLP